MIRRHCNSFFGSRGSSSSSTIFHLSSLIFDYQPPIQHSISGWLYHPPFFVNPPSHRLTAMGRGRGRHRRGGTTTTPRRRRHQFSGEDQTRRSDQRGGPPPRYSSPCSPTTSRFREDVLEKSTHQDATPVLGLSGHRFDSTKYSDSRDFNHRGPPGVSPYDQPVDTVVSVSAHNRSQPPNRGRRRRWGRSANKSKPAHGFDHTPAAGPDKAISTLQEHESDTAMVEAGPKPYTDADEFVLSTPGRRGGFRGGGDTDGPEPSNWYHTPVRSTTPNFAQAIEDPGIGNRAHVSAFKLDSEDQSTIHTPGRRRFFGDGSRKAFNGGYRPTYTSDTTRKSSKGSSGAPQVDTRAVGSGPNLNATAEVTATTTRRRRNFGPREHRSPRKPKRAHDIYRLPRRPLATPSPLDCNDETKGAVKAEESQLTLDTGADSSGSKLDTESACYRDPGPNLAADPDASGSELDTGPEDSGTKVETEAPKFLSQPYLEADDVWDPDCIEKYYHY
ncbi:hypothetical protein FN846DRAFT_887459 [Sphaerosporella brunnea]|uniref:Uncharacterized protein n=1 Tax=Sphaerosporella brunnea TaxID=1250544 RepID=A0A5J5F689_9PEZI|nr:hypothetical protein FN846DRAFT_887459 [Sphaerosporella brunnea]